MNSLVYSRSVSDPGISKVGPCRLLHHKMSQGYCKQQNCSFHLDRAYSKKQNHKDFCFPDALQPAEVACSRGSGSREKEHTWHSSLQSALLQTEQGLRAGVCPFYHHSSPPTLARQKEAHSTNGSAHCRGAEREGFWEYRSQFLREQRERIGGWEHLSQCHLISNTMKNISRVISNKLFFSKLYQNEDFCGMRVKYIPWLQPGESDKWQLPKYWMSTNQQRSLLLSFKEKQKGLLGPSRTVTNKEHHTFKPRNWQPPNLQFTPHFVGSFRLLTSDSNLPLSFFQYPCVLYPFRLYDVNGTEEEKCPSYWVLLLTS